MGGSYDFPPEVTMQSNFINRTIVVNPSALASSNVLMANTLRGSHYYFMVLWFVEFSSNVNASGQRVFDVAINGEVFEKAIDIYGRVGPYTTLEVYSSTEKPLGPYVDKFVIEIYNSSFSDYNPSLAAAEILQLFDNPMNTTTSSSDGLSPLIQLIFRTLN